MKNKKFNKKKLSYLSVEKVSNGFVMRLIDSNHASKTVTIQTEDDRLDADTVLLEFLHG